MTREEILSIRDHIGYWANNCGGCETCYQHFGNAEEPTFDMETVYKIITFYENLLPKPTPDEPQCPRCHSPYAINSLCQKCIEEENGHGL